MGNNSCSCVYVLEDQSMHIMPDDDKVQFELMKKIVKMQGLIRGFLVRRRNFRLKIMKYNLKVTELLNQFYREQLGKYQKVEAFDFSLCEQNPLGQEQHKLCLQHIGQLCFKNPTLVEGGSLYVGEWLEKARSGRGVQVWKDGRVYEGQWRQGAQQGYGRLLLPSGDVYQGEFQAGRRHGWGVMESKNGTIYEGNWLKDKPNGKGKEKWKEGAVFEGLYVDGKKEGQGIFKWNDSSYYKGQFKGNQIQGHGHYTWPDGRQYQGQWVQDQMHGLGIFIWPDKRMYLGDFQKDKRTGFGVFIWPDKKIYYGYFQKGKQEGTGVQVHSELKQKRLGEWKGGKRERWVIFEGSELMGTLDKQFEDYTKQLKKSENTLFPKDILQLSSLETVANHLSNVSNHLTLPEQQDNNHEQNSFNQIHPTVHEQPLNNSTNFRSNILQQSIDNIHFMQTNFKEINLQKI